jgi:D-galactose 1-dehydrogenase/L-arabinose 1- dehydrogenase
VSAGGIEIDVSLDFRSIYRAFAQLIASGRSDVDARPLQLVADIFLIGKQITVASFEDPRA